MTAYELRISDWSSDVCSSYLPPDFPLRDAAPMGTAIRSAKKRRRSRDQPNQRAMHNMAQRQGCRTAEKNKEGSLGVGRSSVVLILLAHQCQGARRDLVGRAPMDERVLAARSAEHTSELQSLMRNSYAVFCLKK